MLATIYSAHLNGKEVICAEQMMTLMSKFFSNYMGNFMSLKELRHHLNQHADSKKAVTQRIFFKNSRDDIFLGIPTKSMRQVAKQFWQIPLSNVQSLMKSRVHDERAVAHAILRLKFNKADEKEQAVIFNFYIENRKHIRDWGGVDDSAPYIAGVYLMNRDKKILYTLAVSNHIWDRRIAIVTTWWFIRQNEFKHALSLAKQLLKDEEDLIHKAVGWMLREIGKRDIDSLELFLQKHAHVMPRTMLRYAIEKFPQNKRKKYLALPSGNKGK